MPRLAPVITMFFMVLYYRKEGGWVFDLLVVVDKRQSRLVISMGFTILKRAGNNRGQVQSVPGFLLLAYRLQLYVLIV